MDNDNVGYAFVVGDLFHFGHLHFLYECKKHCDFLVVGVFTDRLTATYKRTPIIPFNERFEIISALKVVDMAVTVHTRDQTMIMRQLVEMGYNLKYLFHGDDWNATTDKDLIASKEFIESIGGKLVQPRYYEGRSTTSIINKIVKRYGRKTD